MKKINHSETFKLLIKTIYSKSKSVNVTEQKIMFSVKGIVNLCLCDSQKLYLNLTFTKTPSLICLN